MNHWYSILILFSLFMVGCTVESQDKGQANKAALRNGKLRGMCFQKDGVTVIPFDMEVKGDSVFVRNGAENISLQLVSKDSMYHYNFPVFDTRLHFKVAGDSLVGYLETTNTRTYQMSFTAKYDQPRFTSVETDAGEKLMQRWKTSLTYSSGVTNGLAGFEVIDGQVRCNLRTETGDYRFLTGVFSEKRLQLSSVNGGSALLIDATMVSDSVLEGRLYSGAKYSCPFKAEIDDTFSLTSAYSMTHVVDKEQKVEFLFPSDKGEMLSLDDSVFNDKVVVVQISGFWCPNCMDETRVMVDFYNKYKSKGLEVVMLDYELKNDFDLFKKRAAKYRSDLGVDYNIVLGGLANKDSVSAQFPMLNKIYAFPTSIILNKKKEVVKIHTGFSGPSTGIPYFQYIEQTDQLLGQLLAQ